MPCCGQKRVQQRSMSNSFAPERAAPRAAAGRMPMGTAYFAYTGEGAVTVIGGATGRQYRFETPGVPLMVDARDRWGLAKIPVLREIR